MENGKTNKRPYVPSWRGTENMSEEAQREREEQTRIAKACDRRYARQFTLYMVVLIVAVVLLILFFRS